MTRRETSKAPLFDGVAERYDRWCETPLGSLTEAAERSVLDSLLPRPLSGLRVLDVGCGTGTWALHLAAQGALVTGIDVSPAMIDVAREKVRRAGQPAAFLVAAGDCLPFASDGFDLVTAMLVLEFAENSEAVLSEMARVLRPGGKAVVAALNRRSIWTVLRRLGGWRRPTVYNHARFLTRREIDAMLAAAGLDPTVHRAAVFFPPVRATCFQPLLRGLEAGGRKGWGLGPAYLVTQADKPYQVSSKRKSLRS